MARTIKKQTIDGESTEYLSPKEQVQEDQRQAMENARDANGALDLTKAIGFTTIVTPDHRT